MCKKSVSTIAMRISDLSIRKRQRNRDEWIKRAIEAVILDLPVATSMEAGNNALKEHKHLVFMGERSRHVRSTFFNLNVL